MYASRLKLDANLLMVFIAVAEIGRISEAAKQLHLSQPAVTAQIRKLEETLSTALFLRSVRGVSLTAAGRKLLDYARQVRRLVDEASEQVATHQKSLSGALNIAASTTIAGHVLPQVLTAFHQLHPQVAISVEVGNTDDVLGRVREGRVPLGLVEGHGRAARLRLEPFVPDEIVPVVGTAIADKRLLERVNKVQRLEDLITLPIIWREPGSGTRAVVEAAFEAAGLTRRAAPDLVLGTTQAIRSAAVCGLGVAFLSRWCMQNEIALGKLRPLNIAGLNISRAFHWALPAGGVGAVAERFLDFARRSPPKLPRAGIR